MKAKAKFQLHSSFNKLVGTGYTSYIFIFFFICACCDEDGVKPNDQIESKGIESKWQWQYSESGWGKMTPESKGFNRYLEFDDFYYSEFINDSLVTYLQYDIEVRPDSFNGTNKYLVLENSQEYSFAFIGNDTLRLYELCFDCALHQFIRL